MTGKQHHLLRALGFTLAAIALYIPANLYPFMTMKYGGRLQYTTMWDGIRTLYDQNMWFTATVVFMASIIIPIFKLFALLYIILSKLVNKSSVERASLLIFVDFIGRWAMLDIFLLSIMVALVKFDSYATVTADLGSYLLAAVVVFTMLASAMLSMKVKEE